MAQATARAGARRAVVVLSWFFGLGLVIAVVLVATHFVEEKAFARLVERMRPRWILAAVVLQLGTYWAEAQLWWVVLDRTGSRRGLRALFGLAFAKLFLDQMLPSAGVSGSLLVVRGLERRGVPRGTCLAAVLLELRTYYVAYATALAGALALLATHQRLSRLVLVPSIVFIGGVAAASLFFAFGPRARVLGRIRRVRFLRPLAEALSEAPPEVARDGRLFVSCCLLELTVIALDALTLGVLLHAVGSDPHPSAVFASFMLASLARTMGPVPGGLGTFEAVAVATLGLAGVPVAEALAATLLFRGFSFWLPLLPGLVLTRHEARITETAT